MPELPEVETVRQGLAPLLEKRRIAQATARRPDLRRPLPPGFARRLTGQRIERLERRGKYLLAALDGGHTLLAHLGMTGRFLILDPDAADAGTGPHDHIVLDLEAGPGGRPPPTRVVFRDPRRFGVMDLVPTAERDSHRLLRGLGPEPLGPDFHATWLRACFVGRRAAVKPLLLDQRLIAGMGNIYASESLHRAGISPRRPAGRISALRTGRLVEAIRAILTEAIAAGGSTLRDFRGADGELGYFQHAFTVYGREAGPCPKPGCRGTIRSAALGGRATYWCPACQR